MRTLTILAMLDASHRRLRSLEISGILELLTGCLSKCGRQSVPIGKPLVFSEIQRVLSTYCAISRSPMGLPLKRGLQQTAVPTCCPIWLSTTPSEWVALISMKPICAVTLAGA